ncbi:glyoxalase [Rhodanobacter sp. B05]|uniref:VOC family protein n=1 Tax=Rhodanobacter sp. B05 TaxID=1945859 RepID=UPI0009859EA4|nr:VOC family protein [Rhodanobacter sp. B05]OOG60990.1 glyoxalase [Rhodanobacter sp. B05]
MAKVTGLGGIFFKSRDPVALSAWYAKHLGMIAEEWGGVRFNEDEQRAGYTLWSPFAADTSYFGSGPQSCMLNFRVDDLDALLAQLRADGVVVDERVDQSEFGRFGWITDPEGTRVELWQPPA